MKIAVIDHISNPGGGSRVVRSLLAAMKKVRPDLDITFFGNPHGMKRENIEEIAREHGIKVCPLSSMRWAGRDIFGLRGSRHIIGLLQRKLHKLLSFFPFCLSGQLERELNQVVRGFDVAFFTWPFHMKCPDLDCPMVGIFHDFNFRYWFGAGMAAPWVLDSLMTHTPILLDRMTPVVSTEYMKTEVKKFYPQFGDKVHVAPIAPMSNLSQVDAASIEKILKKFHLPKKFILAPTNVAQHKNLGPLMAAMELLRKRGHAIALVIVGVGTEIYNGKACAEGIELSRDQQDVYGLGYVDNLEIDGLIQSAQMVVNPSLYEGGNGPGFDAWSRGIPVAMSNIPPFLEHVAYHDVKAAIFNPRSPEDIADKIADLLENPEKAKENAEHSLKSISRFSWETTAEKYLSVFDLAIASRKQRQP